MRTFLFLVSIVTVLASAVPLLASPNPSTSSDAPSVVDSRFDELLAMPADARRAKLRSMSPDERRGLWFRLKRAQVEQRRDAEAASSPSPSTVTAGTPKAVRTTPHPVSAIGTIQYDDGTGSTTFAQQGPPNNILRGNRFNTHGGGNPVTASGTVDTVVAVVAPRTANTTSSAGFVMYNEQNTATGGAVAVFSTFTSVGTTVTATETVTFTGMGANYLGDSFLVLFGNFDASFVPVFGTGTTQSQGHHAALGSTGAGNGPDVTNVSDMSGLNGLIRVTGNVLPVELMTYSVE